MTAPTGGPQGNDLLTRIEDVFGPLPFPDALFYQVPGGLRFELAEGPTWLGQFLTAFDKAREVCASVFDPAEPVVIVLQDATNDGIHDRLPYRALAEFEDAGVVIPPNTPVRATLRDQGEDDTESDAPPWFTLTVALEVPASLLPNLIWCAVTTEMAIKPRPMLFVALVHLRRGIVVHPYDDRGMDIVGPNHAELARLYHRWGNYLLDYDREEMDETFSHKAQHSANKQEP